MDPLSILPLELRKRIYSYYFEPDTDPLCTLEIVQGETRHREQTKGLAKKLSRTAEELETRTHFGNTAIEVLIEEIQSTASALDAANEADRSADAAAKLRFPEIVRGSDAVRELNKAEKEVGLKLQIRPKESCCHFFNLAHVSRQVHADLFSFCAFGLGGNMETFQPIFSGSNSMCRERSSSSNITPLYCHRSGRMLASSNRCRIFARSTCRARCLIPSLKLLMVSYREKALGGDTSKA